MTQFPTPIQDIALSLVFLVMGESQINRSHEDYMRIAEALPPLKQLHHQINVRLKELHAAGPMPEIVRFAAGHKRIVFELYPTEISYETLRAALTISGMRQPKRQMRTRRAA